MLTLNSIEPDSDATVSAVRLSGSIHRRMLDIGLIPGTKVKCLQRSPHGDISAYLIRGAIIAIRKEDAEMIEIL